MADDRRKEEATLLLIQRLPADLAILLLKRLRLNPLNRLTQESREISNINSQTITAAEIETSRNHCWLRNWVRHPHIR